MNGSRIVGSRPAGRRWDPASRAAPACCRRRKFTLAAAGILVLVQLAGCGDDLTTRERIDKALDHKTAGELQSAVIELRNVLQAEPNNAEARLLLGRTYIQFDDLGAAEKELRRAIELGAPRERVVIDLGVVLLGQGASRAVLDEVDVESAWSTDLRASAHALRARAHIQLDDLLAAHEALGKAEALDAGSLQTRLARVELALARRQLDRADRLIDEAAEQYPDSLAVWRTGMRVAAERDDVEAGEAAADRAIELAGNPIEDRLYRARLRVARGDLDGAREDLDKIGDSAADHPRVRLVRGMISWAESDFESACNEFQEAVSDAPRFTEAQLFLGACQMRSGELNQAEANLSAVYQRSPVPEVARLLGVVRLALGQPELAREVVRPVLDQQPDDPATLALLGRIEMRLGNTAAAIGHLQRLGELRPDDPGAKLQLGAGLLQAGDTRAGYAALDEAMELDPEFGQAGVMRVLSHLRAEEYEQALEQTGEMAESMQDSALPWTLAALVHAAQEDEVAARDALERAIERVPADPAARNFLARLELRNDDIDAARDHFRAVLEAEPEHTATLTALGELEATQGNFQQAADLLLRAHQSDPDSLRARVLLGRLRLSRGDPEGALAIVTREDGQVPANAAALDTASRAHLALGQPERAIEILRRWVELDPGAVGARLLLGSAHAAAGDSARAVALTEEEFERNPDNIEARVALARARALQGRIEEARELVAGMSSDAAHQPHVLETRAIIATESGEHDRAVRLYRQLVERARTGANIVKLARAMRAAGDVAGGTALVEQWLEEHPDDAGAWMARGDMALLEGDRAGAISGYRSALEAAPEMVEAMNNLAWLLREQSPDEALDLARRAVKGAPERASVRDTLGMVLLAQGRAAAAVEEFRRALEQLPDSPVLRYHLARALAEAGRRDEARASLRRVLDSGVAFAERAEAEQLMRDLEGGS